MISFITLFFIEIALSGVVSCSNNILEKVSKKSTTYDYINSLKFTL